MSEQQTESLLCPVCKNYPDTPNHELGCPAGRDADNALSVQEWVREYAEALAESDGNRCFKPSAMGLTADAWEPYRQQYLKRARACVAVEERHTAALEGALNHERDVALASVQRQRVAEVAELRRMLNEAEILAASAEAEVERLRVDVQYLNDRLADRRDEIAALRGPVPTEDGA